MCIRDRNTTVIFRNNEANIHISILELICRIFMTFRKAFSGSRATQFRSETVVKLKLDFVKSLKSWKEISFKVNTRVNCRHLLLFPNTKYANRVQNMLEIYFTKVLRNTCWVCWVHCWCRWWWLNLRWWPSSLLRSSHRKSGLEKQKIWNKNSFQWIHKQMYSHEMRPLL